MQTSLRGCGTAASTSASYSTQRCARVARLLQPAPLAQRNGRSRNLQVLARAGGRSKGGRSMMQQQGSSVVPQIMDWDSQPAPEVDAKNVQFVVFVRNTKYEAVKGSGPTVSYWVPLGPISGGAAANLIVQGMASEWGRKLFGNLLTRNIALGIYRDPSRSTTETRLRSTYNVFRNASSKDIQYGFNVRDRTKPKDWYKPMNITVCPPETALGGTPQDAIKDFFSPGSIKAMFNLQ